MTTATLVETILKRNEQARNDDKVLIGEVLKHYGLILSPLQLDVFFNLPAMETVTRVRRQLQKEGKYKATDAVEKERQHKSYMVQQIAVDASPEYLAQTLESKPNWKDKTNWTYNSGFWHCLTCKTDVFGGLCDCYED